MIGGDVWERSLQKMQGGMDRKPERLRQVQKKAWRILASGGGGDNHRSARLGRELGWLCCDERSCLAERVRYGLGMGRGSSAGGSSSGGSVGMACKGSSVWAGVSGEGDIEGGAS